MSKYYFDDGEETKMPIFAKAPKTNSVQKSGITKTPKTKNVEHNYFGENSSLEENSSTFDLTKIPYYLHNNFASQKPVGSSPVQRKELQKNNFKYNPLPTHHSDYIRQAAARGVQGPGQRSPHFAKIQAAQANAKPLPLTKGYVGAPIQRIQSGRNHPVHFHQNALRLQKMTGNRAVVQLSTQLRQANEPENTASVHAIASAGVKGPGHKLPHFDKVQAAFGRRDISHVQAYTGSQAAAANHAIGAKAYTTEGNKIAFAEPNPDLHTVVHETVHTFQQEDGVQLKGGVGEADDQYEHQANKIADAVIQGKSAENLLDINSYKISSTNVGYSSGSLATNSANSGNMPIQMMRLKSAKREEIAIEPNSEVLSNELLTSEEETSSGATGNKQFDTEYYNKDENIDEKKFEEDFDSFLESAVNNVNTEKMEDTENPRESILNKIGNALERKIKLTSCEMYLQKIIESRKSQLNPILIKIDSLNKNYEMITKLKDIKEFIEAQYSFQKDVLEIEQLIGEDKSSSNPLSGLFTTVGFEYEFDTMKAKNVIDNVEHLEIAKSKDTMPYKDLPFILETDNYNGLELVTPPFLIKTINREHPVPNKADTQAINDLFENNLKNIRKAGQNIGELLKKFKEIWGLQFKIEDKLFFTPDMIALNINKERKIRKIKRRTRGKMVRIGKDSRQVKKSAIESIVLISQPGIGTQINFATNWFVYSKINQKVEGNKVSIVKKILFDSIQDKLSGINQQSIVYVFIDELTRVLSMQLAIPFIKLEEKFQQGKGKKFLNQMIKELKEDLTFNATGSEHEMEISSSKKEHKKKDKKQKQELQDAFKSGIIEKEKQFTTTVKEMNHFWVKANLLQILWQECSEKQQRKIINLISDKEFKSQINQKIDSLFPKGSGFEWLKPVLPMLKIKITSILNLFNHEDKNLLKKFADIVARQDTYIKPENVRMDKIWNNKNLFVIEARDKNHLLKFNLDSLQERKNQSHQDEKILKIEGEKVKEEEQEEELKEELKEEKKENEEGK